MRIVAVPLLLACLALAARAEATPPTVSDCVTKADTGQLDRDAGRYRSAERSFEVCANAACPTQIRNDCTQWLSDVLKGAPSVVFVVHDERGADLEDVVVSAEGEVLATRIDGRAVRVDPGKHQFVFQSPHRAAVRLPLLVHTAVKDRVVSVQLGPRDDETARAPEPLPPPQPTPPPQPAPRDVPRSREPPASTSSPPVAALLLGGAGIVAISTAAYFWVSARSDLSSLEDDPCAATKRCSPSSVSSVRTRLLVGDLLGGAGLAAIGVGVWIWLARSNSASAALRVTPAGARLLGTF